MGTRAKWLAGLLLVGVLGMPATAHAQPNISAPSVELPLPLMSGYRESGFFVGLEGLFLRMDNPLAHQVIAVRGIQDLDGSIGGTAGEFIGSRATALSTDDDGDDGWEPGVRLNLGWRFRNDVVLSFSYWKMAEYRATAGAGITPFNGSVGDDLADSFLTAPFFNVTSLFSGPDDDVQVGAFLGNPITVPAFGIWNAADQMTTEFVQRIWSAEITVRIPTMQTDSLRTYMITGPRYIPVYERFRFRTVDEEFDGDSSPEDVAVYENKWENRLYGWQFGGGSECYLPGGFALSIEGRLAIYANIRHTNVRVFRDNNEDVVIQRTDNDARISPGFQLGAYLWWYPMEGVQIRAGYEFLGVLNVRRSTRPVSFDLGNLDPEYQDNFMRLDGWNIGFAFIF